jgi:SagB-type dehydrogenase family enzyme
MLLAEDGTTLSRLFHLNSEPWMNFEAYAEHPYEVEFKHEKGIAEPVELPGPDPGSRLYELLAKRRSCRAFASEFLPAATLGALLGGAYGLTGETILSGGLRFHSRAVPSAGGLYPLELYVLTNRVENITNAVHHYEVATRLLRPIKPGPTREELTGTLLTQPFLESANAIVFISAVFHRTLGKYGSRGYRYVLFEAGHVAQNLCLLAADLNLASLCAGGFWDSRLNRFLGLDGVDEAVVYCVGIGRAATEPPS